MRNTANLEFEAVRKHVNLVDLRSRPLAAKIGFDAVENGPSKVWATNSNRRRPPSHSESNKHLCRPRPSSRAGTRHAADLKKEEDSCLLQTEEEEGNNDVM